VSLSDARLTVAHTTAARLVDAAVKMLAAGIDADRITVGLWDGLAEGTTAGDPEAVPYAFAVAAAAIVQSAIDRRTVAP